MSRRDYLTVSELMVSGVQHAGWHLLRALHIREPFGDYNHWRAFRAQLWMAFMRPYYYVRYAHWRHP